MKRFVFSPEQRQGEIVVLNVQESQHVTRVLRLAEGALIELVDGSETLLLGKITKSVRGERVVAHIVGKKMIEQRDRGSLWLAQCIIKAKNMELLLQKCTELGVTRFTPCISSRCQGNLVEQADKKSERWERIINEACKQCKREEPMVLEKNSPLQELVERDDDHGDICRVVLFEGQEGRSLNDIKSELRSCSTVQLLIGPEGGFVADEIKELERTGYISMGLGSRILRAETAAIAAVSIIQHIRGNM